MSKFFNNFINVKIYKKSNDRILRKCLSRTHPVFTCSKLTTKTPKQGMNMFKINNKDTRMTPISSFWCLYCKL